MNTELRITRVFVELADTLVDEFDALDFLHTLTERSAPLAEAQTSRARAASGGRRIRGPNTGMERCRGRKFTTTDGAAPGHPADETKVAPHEI
jgi:hypothetical protein